MSPTFVPSLRLNEAFHREVVAPLVAPAEHAAALLGWGSDVLGFDSERSTDHGWGPRLLVFVAETDVAAVRARVEAGLPETFRGWPVRFGWDGAGPRHWVQVQPFGAWLAGQLGVDPLPGMTVLDWLTVPQQRLLGVVRGAVYADPAGELAAVREALRWYPDDVWRWLLAAQWRRVEQEEAFVGRASEAGDELGSRLVAARLVRELMALVFLLDREYRPYTKWFGTAFTRLPTGAALRPVLERVTAATGLPAREAALAEVYEAVAVRHNAVAGTAEVEPRVRGFHARPYRVLGAGRFVQACLDTVEDPWLRALPLVGSVDQFADSTDVLSAPAVAGRLRAVYTGPVPATP